MAASFRPSDNKVYAELSIGCPEIVDRAVVCAERAFRKTSWATGGPRERAQILRRWADLIEGHAIELGSIDAVGSTRPIQRNM
jgi:aldehyde dehydrogenase (NAD+)